MRKICKDNPNKGLSFLYNTYVGRIILKPLVKSKFISALTGKFMDSSISKFMIKPFIKSHNIKMEEYITKKYNSFNDFFIRNIKKEARLINGNKNALIAPCDSKLTCYEITKDLKFNVKNSTYSVSSLINDENVANAFIGGYALVFRLSPEDYHHYLFCDDGIIINNYKIDGKYHSVNPIVYDNYKVFRENTRECTLVKTNNFKNIMYVEVGALLVGKICNIKKQGKFKKGEEKGYFMYGGSTVILLIQKDALLIDDEIIKNSSKNIETYVKCGEKIGEKKN
ncbi:MAG: phosphatidylserine decarboxylase [Candidatus Aphodocola sp.]